MDGERRGHGPALAPGRLRPVSGPDSGEERSAWALAGLALPMLLASLGTSVANVGLPAIGRYFGAPFQAVQWVVLAYLLATTLLIVSAGRLGDMLGRRRLLLAGIALFTVSCALCGAAPTLPLLIGARVLQGLGAAIMMALTMALAGDAVSKSKAGSAMGLLGTMSAVGTALGPALGGLLIAGSGWRAMFLACVPLGAAAMLLAGRSLPPEPSAPPASAGRFDHRGTLLLAASLGAFALAMTMGKGSFGVRNAGLLCMAVLAAAAFVMAQRRTSFPLIQPALFGDPVLRAGVAMSILVTAVMMATLVVGPFYLTGGLGLGTAAAGIAMSCGPAVAALGGVPAGRMTDLLGVKRTTAAGLLLMMAGCALLALMPPSAGIAGYVGPLAVLTFGYALFQAANNTAIMSAAAPGQRGVVSALASLARNLGLIAGASAMAGVFAAGQAGGGPARGMHLTFMVGLALLACALAVALRAWRRR